MLTETKKKELRKIISGDKIFYIKKITLEDYKQIIKYDENMNIVKYYDSFNTTYDKVQIKKKRRVN